MMISSPQWIWITIENYSQAYQRFLIMREVGHLPQCESDLFMHFMQKILHKVLAIYKKSCNFAADL
jgi:hypothetical protein